MFPASLLDQVPGLPAMPATAARLLELLRNPEVDMREVAEAVELDPGLAGNALRMANAALLRGDRRIASVGTAVFRIGLLRIYQVVVATVVGPRTRVRLACYGLGPEELWNHSIAVAAGTREVARAAGVAVSEEAFTAGLLHDVGKLVLGLSPEAASGPLRPAPGQSWIEAERARFGTDHAEAGAFLLERWRFPAAVVGAIRAHHAPVDDRGAALVHLADLLCRRGEIGCRCSERQDPPAEAALELLGLSRRALEGLRVAVEKAYGEIRAQFI